MAVGPLRPGLSIKGGDRLHDSFYRVEAHDLTKDDELDEVDPTLTGLNFGDDRLLTPPSFSHLFLSQLCCLPGGHKLIDHEPIVLAVDGEQWWVPALSPSPVEPIAFNSKIE